MEHGVPDSRWRGRKRPLVVPPEEGDRIQQDPRFNKDRLKSQIGRPYSAPKNKAVEIPATPAPWLADRPSKSEETVIKSDLRDEETE